MSKYLKLGPWILVAVLALWGYSQHRAADKARTDAEACAQAIEDGKTHAALLQAQVQTKTAEIAGLNRDLLKARINQSRPGAVADSPESIPVSEKWAKEAQSCLETQPLVKTENESLWASNSLLESEAKRDEKSRRKWKTWALVSTGMFATLVTVDLIRR